MPTLLILNAGSSSLKFRLFDAASLAWRVRGQVGGIGTDPNFELQTSDGHTQQIALPPHTHHATALEAVLNVLPQYCPDQTMAAVGHRVVHGGADFTGPVRITPEVLARLETLIPLAPLHQPHNLAAIRLLITRQPEVPQFACFDTAFHRTQPLMAQFFGLPRHYFDAGVRRYGFHGLSYESIAARLSALDPRAAAGRTIVCHLGHGASLCALHACRSLATTMSFTPADGLLMGTRCGTLDPGVIPYLMRHHGLTLAQVETLIDQESGLLGVSGISADMRVLLASSDPNAQLAVELFVYRICREIGSLAAALGGLDAMVFTGGIGEHSAEIRRRVAHQAAWLGLQLDEAANAAHGPSRNSCISTAASRVTAWVLPADEEAIIAHQIQPQLGTS